MDIHLTLRSAQASLNAGRLDEAVGHLRTAVQLAPNVALIWNELGTVLARTGDMTAAVDAFRRAVELQPTQGNAQHNLGLALFHLNRLDEAEIVYRELLTRDANDVNAHFGLGTIQERRQQFDLARQSYETAIARQPSFTEAHINLGNVLWELGRSDDAQRSMNRAIELDPKSVAAARNLGLLFSKAGLVNREINQYRKALALDPPESEAANIHGNLIWAMFYQSPYSPQAHFEEHVRWAKRFADPITARANPIECDRSQDRRLRVGYVSPDFRLHPVATFIEPILTHHDRAAVEVYCYASVAKSDDVTVRLRAKADVWRDIAGMSDDAAAKQIRDDRIDLLIDLAGHGGGNRLLLFARKPAPIQVSYLGYMATTGLRAIDYRLTDAFVDPPGKTERFHTEQLVRLPEKFYAYQPPPGLPPSGAQSPHIDVPKRANGYVTFASFNRLVKVSNDALVAWARIMREVERSRLRLLAPGSLDAAERCLTLLERHGVARDRVELVPGKPYEEYLRSLAKIDIGLDAFPASGHTTTCNTLWMGTPVVALAGETYVSRLGASVLSNLGLNDLIANDVDEYVRIAIELARDDARLVRLRQDLRPLVEDRLASGAQVARRLEDAYRTMWKRWCNRESR